MTPYKRSLLILATEISKEFFSHSRSARIEKAASGLFDMFIKQVKENSEDQTMYMMLKILTAEAIMLKGARTNGYTETDA